MTKHKYVMEGKGLTALVMSSDEFVNLVGIIRATGVLSEEQLGEIQTAGHLPLVVLGTKTKTLFDRFDIDTELMSAIVRGKAQEIMNDSQLTTMVAEEAENLAQQAEESISEPEKKKIQDVVNKVYVTVANGGDPSDLVNTFIYDNGQLMTVEARKELARQTLASLATTLWTTRQQLSQKAWEDYFPNYVRRLFVRIYSAMIGYVRN